MQPGHLTLGAVEASAKYRVPAVDKALDIMEFLSTQTEPVPLGYLAKQIDRTTNEVFRVVDRLVYRGYLVKDSVSGALSLSMRTWMIANSMPPLYKLIRLGAGPMARLSSSTGLSCHLSVLESDRVYVVHEEPPAEPVAIRVKVGSSFPAASTSSGRCLLSLYKRNADIDVMASGTEEAGTDLTGDNKIDYMQLVQRQSWFHPDVTDLVIVLGETGYPPIAALVVPFIATRNRRAAADIQEDVTRAADEIAQAVGLNPS
jgi:DNA-binding IclR family transcriptional regulator